MTGIELYDTTLRDGAQMEGISISVDDKLAIAKRLDEIGFHYIEGGYAGANPKEDEFFRRVRELDLKQAKITAFGNTRRADVRLGSIWCVRSVFVRRRMGTWWFREPP